MRKYFLLYIMLACLHMAARGQTITDLADIDLSGLPQPTQAKALRYWFDEDAATVQSTAQLTGNHLLDVSELMEGLHTLHYQVIGSDDEVAYVGSSLFMKVAERNSLTVRSMRYWFDEDAASLQTAGGTTGTYTIGVEKLLDGLHTLHYQLIDENGLTAYVGSGIFLKVSLQDGEQVAASSLHYWFDDDKSGVKSLASAGVHTLDVSGLLDGLHTIHCQVKGSDGQVSYISSALFLKAVNGLTAGKVQAQELLYWFDDDTTIRQSDFGSGAQLLDASMLTDGLHTLHYQVLCNNGQMTPSMSTLFLRVNSDAETAVAKSLRYWFDEAQTAVEIELTDGVQQLDASALIEGLHTVHYQIADSKGTLGAPSSSIFLKVNATTSAMAQSLRYWFDDDAATVATTSVSGGTQVLDVSALQTGLHTLNYQLIDDRGQLAVPVTRFFIKNFDKVIEGGQNRITKYQYWVNQNSQAMQTVTVNATTNPYTLIALLPMQKESVKSSLFHFEVTNGQPTIYTKNVLHTRFYDAQNYFTDGDKSFIDYSVSQKVEPVGELQVTQTFPKLAENDIRWYTVQAAPGDTLAFRLSQAATMQVFAPSGEEVFKTSEDASVRWAGIHSWEDGTYYLAVHDVTGSQPNMTLDYMHMDKYDVVDWDVHTVGNGGCSTITFKGNGFRDLYAVDLYTVAGDSIHSVDVSHDSDAETAVTFDFTDAELGVYDAVFHFTEEDKAVSDVMTVEEAVDIELATNVTFPSTFLRGTSTTYTIKITNKGNMTAYAVPIYTYIKCHDMNDIKTIKYDGLGLTPLMDGIDTDGMSSVEIEQLRTALESLGDSHHFLKFKVADENSGKNDSVAILSNYFLINIAPKEIKTLTLTISTFQYAVEAYFTTPKDWYGLTYKQDESSFKRRALTPRRSPKNWYCCYREGIECVADLVTSLADVGSLVMGVVGAVDPALLPAAGAVAWADCAMSIGNSGLKAAGEFACGSGEEQLKERLRNSAKAASKSALGATLSCISAKLSAVADLAKMKGKILAGISSELSGNVVGMDISGLSCVTKFTKPIPGCPPDPGGGGGSSTPVPPSDPNDIYGYLSGAGSKFIADSVAKVNYTIEFENDTAFAEASAHTIVIRDTLDSRYFDLKSFLPTSIKLGGREAFLDEADVTTQGGVTNFLTTIDVRPEINAIAQVEGTYSQQTGIAEWRFTSLDPMTMEPTDDLMQGILPVNYDGTSGIGEVMFEVGVKPGKADGTEIANRAGIVFDYEEAILTPTWVNTVDAVAPMSRITEAEQVAGDSLLTLRWTGEDARSGIWYYDVYAQAGYGASWELVAEHVTGTECSVRIFEDIEYGFCIVATDMAGNRERKAMQNELMPENTVGVSVPDTESDGSSGELYDLSGRRTDARRTGVYIQGGRLWYFKR